MRDLGKTCGSMVLELARRVRTALSTLEGFAPEVRQASAGAGECVDRMMVLARTGLTLAKELQRLLEEGEASPGTAASHFTHPRTHTDIRNTHPSPTPCPQLLVGAVLLAPL
jgi:hypothetical protein